MVKMNVKAGRKMLDELEKEDQDLVWVRLQSVTSIKLCDFLVLAGCKRSLGQKILRGLFKYGILEQQSTYWRTTNAWRAKWAKIRADQDPEEEIEDTEESEDSDSKELIPPPKTPVKQKSDPQSIPEGLNIAERIRMSAEQEGEEPPESLKPSPARKKRSPSRMRGRRKKP